METAHSDEIVNQALEAMKKTGIKHEIGNQSTYLYSENPEDIWNSIKAMVNEVQQAGTEFSVNINLSNNT
jgi:uncharacterized protein YqgV (UPF0045/DUF77 family)